MTTTLNSEPLSIDDLWDRLRHAGLGFRDGQLGADTAQAVDEFEALMAWYREVAGRQDHLRSDNASEEFWLTDADIMRLLFDRLERELTARACPLTADYYRVMARLAIIVARQESALAETTLEQLNGGDQATSLPASHAAESTRMSDQVDFLLWRLENLPNEPVDMGSILDTTPVGCLPPPQLTWTLISLINYRCRKIWAWDALTRQLEKDIQRRPKCRFTLQEILDKCVSGVFPGMPEWEFRLDGNDSELVHRVTGESIHIDALNGPEVIGDFRFIEYVKAQRGTGAAEMRLLQLHPQGRGLEFVLSQIRKSGFVHIACDVEFELCQRISCFSDAVADFLLCWANRSNHPWIAAWLGDWSEVTTPAAASPRGLAKPIATRNEATRRQWRNVVESEITCSGLSEKSLTALAAIGGDGLRERLRGAFAEHNLAYNALEIAMDDPSYLAEVSWLFDSLRGQSGSPGLREKCGTYLARHGGQPRDVIVELAGHQPISLWTAIELALAHAQDMLPELLRAGMRSRESTVRLIAAAVCALLDNDWSRGELREVLQEHTDQDATVECRAALSESRCPSARRAVEQWELQYPDPDPKSVVTERFGYRLLSGDCSSALRSQMLRLSDRVRGMATATGGSGGLWSS